MCTSRWLMSALPSLCARGTYYADGIVRAPQIPPMPRRIKNPYLLDVTKELTSEMTPSAAKPNSKTTEAGNKSDRRPAKSRNAAKQSE